MKLSVLLVLLVTIESVFAVPGLERTWKAMHPEQEVSCTTCHARNNGAVPNYDNVTADGRKFYAEIIAKRTSAIPILKKVVPLAKVDLVVMGDSRSDLDTNKEIVDKICADNPKAVIHTGDMVANGSSSKQWNAIVPIYDCLLKKKNLYPACGNHEGDGCTDNVIRNTLENNKAYYTFDLAGYTFVALDSNNITGEEIQWLKSLTPGKRYIPYFHHPAYPVMNGHGPNDGVKRNFIPVFKKLGVKFVLTGHNHGYDRNLVDGIVYVTSGGSGAPLYPCGSANGPDQACVSDYHYLRCELASDTITCQARLIDGTTIDSVTIDFSKK